MKLALAAAAIGGIAVFGFSIWNDYSGMKSEIAYLKEKSKYQEGEIATRDRALEVQRDALSNYLRESARKERIEREVRNAFDDADERRTERRFGKNGRNLADLAATKPSLVEKAVSEATEARKRCFEIASGSELTEAELSAVKPSQINRECPELANPSFEGELK